MISLARANLRYRGFTLIELLVVISIIALLIALLLPSLGAARAVAKTAICLSNHRQATLAISVYHTEWNGALPGPYTSGYNLEGINVPTSQGTNAAWLGAAKATQNYDWISPTMGQMLGLPDDRNFRMLEIFEEKFRCAEVDYPYDYEYGSGFQSYVGRLPNFASSYSMASSFVHVDNDERFASQRGGRYPTPTYPNDLSSSDSWADIDLPDIEGRDMTVYGVGEHSRKIAVFDGSRYFTYSSQQFSFNSNEDDYQGGNFMMYGPALSELEWNGGVYKIGYVDVKRRYGYRHQNNIAVSYFDGHAKTITESESRDMHQYVPKGSRILSDSNWHPETVIGPVNY